MDSLLVSAQWLHDHLGEVKVVDASWYLPAQQRDGAAEYAEGHIPGAVFFDIDAIADTASGLPHMLPSTEAFAAAAGALGLSETDTIVVYDGMGLFSAPRVWWTLTVFGARDVRILDGGLPAWRASGHDLESGPARPRPATFRAVAPGAAVRDLDDMRALTQTRAETIVDARPAPRFAGVAPEPRPGLASGHMPGALSLPSDRLVEDGRLLPPERIRAAFETAGADLAGPIVTTCGSGVTAATLLFALAVAGKTDVALYDGSWAQWGARDDVPIVGDGE